MRISADCDHLAELAIAYLSESAKRSGENKLKDEQRFFLSRAKVLREELEAKQSERGLRVLRESGMGL